MGPFRKKAQIDLINKAKEDRLNTLRDIEQDIKYAYNELDNVTDPDLIDHFTYMILSLESKARFIRKQFK
jgi:hypothetical protein